MNEIASPEGVRSKLQASHGKRPLPPIRKPEAAPNDAVDGSPPALRYVREIRDGGANAMMINVMTVGLDIAKSVFQVHGVDAVGEVSFRRKLTRGSVLAFFESLPRCLVGIEACDASHYWARELIARGHNVRLLPAQ
jgi:hypothetical protein